MPTRTDSAATRGNASTRRGSAILPVALLCAAALAGSPARAQRKASECPPPTRTDDLKETIHGVEIADPYRWLENQTSPETRAWIDAQNRCTEAALRGLPGREQIQKRLTELMKVDSIEVPVVRNGRYFFLKRPANQDLSVLYTRAGPEGHDEVLIDPQPMSPDHSTSISLLNVSDDGRMLIYGVRQGGEDEISIGLLNVEAKENFRDRLPRARYFAFGPDSVPLKPDKSGFYYSKMTKEGPRVFYHAMGTEPENDPEIFGTGYGTDKLIVANLSEDGRYLLVLVAYGSGSEHSEIYVQDLREHGTIVPVVNDLPAFFDGKIAGDTLFLLTNWQAPKWRILAVDLKNPARDRWREIVPESDARIEDFQLVGGKLAVQYTRSAVSEVKLFEPNGKPGGEIALPALGTVGQFRGHWDSSEAFFSFQSFPIPPTVYRYDVATKTLAVWARPDVPIRSDAFEVKQVWYESKDKTRVPMFLFYKKGLLLNGSNPALLTGYGGFDVSETPTFRDEAVVWAERGGVWAVPNLRGGGEFGEAWHHAGMLERKQNVFDDFIAAGEWLVANKYTKPAKLAIQGSSNGGLLVGAALTQRPDLFRAVVCLYPLLDMVRYHQFLVAKWWVPEYGSSDDPNQFKYLYTYSPYQHVRAGTAYPAVLFVTGDGDTRVAPLHARKMAAELQRATNSSRPVLLLYDTKSGHSGGRPLVKRIEEMNDLLSFLFWQLGVRAE